MGSLVDATIRRLVFTSEKKGSIVAETKSRFEETPAVQMVGGVVKPTWKFEDGAGLSSGYQNFYEGYNGAGGASQQNQTGGIVLKDLGDVSSLIPSNGYFLIYNSGSGLWVPSAFSFSGGLGDLSGVHVDNEVDKDILFYSHANSRWENGSAATIGIVISAAAPNEGDVLRRIGSGWSPVDPEDLGLAKEVITDFFAIFIEKPKNKTYTLAHQIPYAIEIGSSSHSFGVGSGSVTPPSGSISSGSTVTLTLSSVSSDAKDLSVRINFTRNLNA